MIPFSTISLTISHTAQFLWTLFITRIMQIRWRTRARISDICRRNSPTRCRLFLCSHSPPWASINSLLTDFVSFISLYSTEQYLKMSGHGKGGKAKGKSKSRSSCAGLQFHVGLIHRLCLLRTWVKGSFSRSVASYFSETPSSWRPSAW